MQVITPAQELRELTREHDAITRTLAYDQHHTPFEDGETFMRSWAREQQQDQERVAFLNKRIAALRRAMGIQAKVG